MSNKKYISIGKILKPHALKGAFKFKPSGIGYEFANHTNRVFIENFDSYYEFNIEKISKFKDMLILKLDKINSIEELDNYKMKELFILREDVILEEDEIFLDDLIGFRAISNNKDVGEVYSFQDYGAGLLYVVKNNDNKEILIPDNDDFVEELDTDNEKIIFKNLEELL